MASSIHLFFCVLRMLARESFTVFSELCMISLLGCTLLCSVLCCKMALIVFFSFDFTQQGLLILIQVTPQKSSYLIFFLWRLYSWGCCYIIHVFVWLYYKKKTPWLLRKITELFLPSMYQSWYYQVGWSRI